MRSSARLSRRPSGLRQAVGTWVIVMLFLAALLFLAVTLVQAGGGPAPGEGFTLVRGVVGAGGVHATSAGFALDATSGQPAAGLVAGAEMGLTAGFWGAPPWGYRVYLPLVLR